MFLRRIKNRHSMKFSLFHPGKCSVLLGNISAFAGENASTGRSVNSTNQTNFYFDLQLLYIGLFGFQLAFLRLNCHSVLHRNKIISEMHMPGLLFDIDANFGQKTSKICFLEIIFLGLSLDSYHPVLLFAVKCHDN